MIVCGDFNGGSECGAIRYMEDGFVDENWREDGEPVTTSKKDLPLKRPLLDVATTVSDREPPPTLVVSELISSLMQNGTEDDPVLNVDMKDRLERIYKQLATHNGKMELKDVEKWLIAINRQLGRGDEYREAARQMGWKDPNPEASFEDQKARIQLPEDGLLTLEGFIEVYRKELRAGKFWGIAHDMAVLGDPLPYAGLYTARFDRIYCSDALKPVAVLDTVCKNACPNEVEPSDHLPIAASFQVA